MVHWSFPTTGDQAADLGFLCFRRLGLRKKKPTPEKPTLSVQCIDIWYMYSIYTVYPPPQRKGYIKRNVSHFRICPQKSRGYHLSLITIYLRNIYLSSICISPPNQVQQPDRSPCHVRARSFDDSTDLHQITYVVLQMSYFTTPT